MFGSSIAECQPANWPGGRPNDQGGLPPATFFGNNMADDPRRTMTFQGPGSGFQQSGYPLRKTASRQASMLSHVAIGDNGMGFGSGVSARRDQKLANKQENRYNQF